MNKIILLCVSLLIVGCSNHTIQNKIRKSNPMLIAQDDDKKPPIPEVNNININHCFSKKTQQMMLDCLRKHDKGSRNAKYIPPFGEVIKLASRSGNEHAKYDLSGKDRFIIFVNISGIKGKITTNIPDTIIHRDNSSNITIDMNVRDIEDSVIIYDGDKNKLLEYSIIK